MPTKNHNQERDITFSSLRLQSMVKTVFEHYFDLKVDVVDPSGEAFNLFPGGQGSPVNFEVYYGTTAEREKRSRACAAEAIENGRPVLAAMCGTHTWFVPVMVDGQARAVVRAGVFLEKLPTREAVISAWQQASGKVEPKGDAAFLDFARALLMRPVINGKLIETLRRLLELGGLAALGHGNVDGLADEAQRLMVRDVAPALPHRFWVRDAIHPNPLQPSLWPDGRLPDWVRRDLGLVEPPSAVVVALPRLEIKHGDTLDTFIHAAHFQHAAYNATQMVPGLVPAAIGLEGVTYLIELERHETPDEARESIKDIVSELQQVLAGSTGAIPVLGADVAPIPGHGLNRIYRNAMQAAALGAAQGRESVFADGEVSVAPSLEPLREAARSLTKAFIAGQIRESDLACEAFLQAVSSRETGRIAVMRVHLLHALDDILETVKTRSLENSGQYRFLYQSMVRDIEQSNDEPILFGAFRQSMSNLAALRTGPERSDQAARIEKARRGIEERYSQPLRLEAVAREAGFSRAVFTQLFREQIGRTFSRFLQDIRIEASKQMLLETSYSLEDISSRAGFGSRNYFLQAFKRLTGTSPGRFRRKSRQVV